LLNPDGTWSKKIMTVDHWNKMGCWELCDESLTVETDWAWLLGAMRRLAYGHDGLGMSVYHDPSDGSARLNLIHGLMSFAVRPELEQRENQLTESLAWLIDHDVEFARVFALLFIDDAESVEALAGAGVIGARTQVSLLDEASSATFFPDLSIATDKRALQLLVEVKPGVGGFHADTVGGQEYQQAEAYAAAWATHHPGEEAVLRWVGTLTAGAVEQRDVPNIAMNHGVRRAKDVTWDEVAGLIEQGVTERLLDSGIEAVARDFLTVLREEFINTPLVSDAELTALLDEGARFLETLRVVFAENGLKPRRGIRRKKDYVGTIIDVPVRDGEVELDLFVSPKGGRYSRRGQPASLVVVAKKKGGKRDSDWGEQLYAAGFRYGQDQAGNSCYRAFFEAAPILHGNAAGERAIVGGLLEMVRGLATVP
jgi:hypothetical protein